jgi:hypothetical protein
MNAISKLLGSFQLSFTKIATEIAPNKHKPQTILKGSGDRDTDKSKK